MTATYKMATKHQQVAKDIVRAAKELNMTLWFRCNKQLHLYHLCCLILAWNLAFLGRSAKECRESRQNCGAAPDTR